MIETKEARRSRYIQTMFFSYPGSIDQDTRLAMAIGYVNIKFPELRADYMTEADEKRRYWPSRGFRDDYQAPIGRDYLTGRLRYIYVSSTEQVLQQEWIVSGVKEWKDVPTVMTERSGVSDA